MSHSHTESGVKWPKRAQRMRALANDPRLALRVGILPANAEASSNAWEQARTFETLQAAVDSSRRAFMLLAIFDPI